MSIAINPNASIVYVDVSSGGKTVSLPLAANCIGKIIRIHDLTGDCSPSNTITVTVESGDSIDGDTTPTIVLNIPFVTFGVIGQSETNFSVIQNSNG